jgi:hypothetical protein
MTEKQIRYLCYLYIEYEKQFYIRLKKLKKLEYSVHTHQLLKRLKMGEGCIWELSRIIDYKIFPSSGDYFTDDDKKLLDEAITVQYVTDKTFQRKLIIYFQGLKQKLELITDEQIMGWINSFKDRR